MGHAPSSKRLKRRHGEQAEQHSQAFLSAQWLEEQIANFFAGDRTIKGEFCLRGIHAAIRFFPIQRLTIAFAEVPGTRPIRSLGIGRKPAEHLLEHPKKWRLSARKALRESEVLSSTPLPCFARNCKLYLDEIDERGKLAFQLFLALHRWGLAPNVTTVDREAFVNYVMKLCPCNGQEFRSAAQQTVSYLFTNWLMPQRPTDFRSYAKRVAYDLYSRSRKHTLTVEEGERENLRLLAGKRRFGKHLVREDGAFSVRELASRADIHYQRINERIQDHRLPAIWKDGKHWIERSTAEQFLKERELKQAGMEIRKLLMKAGNRKKAEALRKRIYRAKKRGASRQQIMELIRKTYDVSFVRALR